MTRSGSRGPRTATWGWPLTGQRAGRIVVAMPPGRPNLPEHPSRERTTRLRWTLRACSLAVHSACVLWAVAGCASAPMGVVSVEPRGALTGNWVLYLLGAHSTEPSGADPESGTRRPATVHSSDLEGRSLGLRGSLNSRVVDLIFGVDRHRIDHEHVREESLGLRVRVPQNANQQTYVEALLRRGHDFPTASGDVDYDGMEVGIGMLVKLERHWFLDVGISFEWTFDRLELDAGEARERVADLMLHLGVVFAL